MLGRMTDKARGVLNDACQQALQRNSEFVGTEHILLSIIGEKEGCAARMLQTLHADAKLICAEIDKLITPGSVPTVTIGQLPYSPRVKTVLELADRASRTGPIGTGHLLWGLVNERMGIAAQVLENLGLANELTADLLRPEWLIEEGLPKDYKEMAHQEPLSDVLDSVSEKLKKMEREILSLLTARSISAAGEGAEAERTRILGIIRKREAYYKEMLDKAAPGNDQNYWGGKRQALEELADAIGKGQAEVSKP